MNKVLFPALLAATIMVAGAFAFMPVEQASTVHLSGTVVAGTITDGAIVTADFAAGAVDSAALADTIAIPTSLTVGSGIVLTNLLTGSQTMAGAAIADNGIQDVVVTVTGADVTNDVAVCTISTNADDDDVSIQKTVITANTVTVSVGNTSGASITVDVADVVSCIVFGIA